MDTVLLRKLTLKSPMRFGKFYDLTVGEIIKYRGFKGTEYLTWVYYCSSNISFMQDVLDTLGIKEENKILKPGKTLDKELSKYMYEAMVNRSINDDATEEEKMQRGRSSKSRHLHRNKAKKGMRIAWTYKYQDKESNRNRNQRKFNPKT